ncbi:terminase large subunit [Edwardsiella phage Edno5]|uniref:Terminase large subunit n=1 Tax=Edwardsiella phage Edno5 TaxID=2419942 RepID=A0A3G3BXZ5_9CAUD|nr:PBSX family phage terminase large subunit [Edwardsiella anguillarum]YP_010052813.1 terminase large subunit [Edwardsiella phage Edno5]AKM48204.1 PBSX family phage terminase, large subunit [Edwardsiella sp. EA181011]AYP69182.1 terminase large subunit [Edwardsiella phage Edno5]RFT04038.1 terminase [Edwardsiella anguillarum]
MTSMAPTLNPVLRDFWTTQARNKILYGGRASSKSWDAAGFAIYLANNYKLRFLCARQIQNKIAESVYALLKIQIERFGLQARFRVLKDKIVNRVTGTEFIFYGLKNSVDEIKSLESIDVLWLEEAHALTEEQWEILEPTIRKEGSECWFIFNPNLYTDFVYQSFIVNTPPRTLVRKINFDENPFLSRTMLDVIEAARDRDEEAFEHVYLGVPRSDDDATVIKRSWIEAAVDAHVVLGFEPQGMRRIGFDVADDGEDKCAMVYAHGSVAYWCEEWAAREDELTKSCYRVYAQAQERDAHITYDSIGVGAFAGSKFSEINAERKLKLRYAKFNAGDAVHAPEKHYTEKIRNKDYFSNLKAQAWWTLADRFRNTFNAIKRGEKFNPDDMISISSDMPMLEKLKTELSTPRRDFDKNGRVKVESKPDLKKRDIKSPNLADAFVMAYAPISRSLIVGENSGW